MPVHVWLRQVVTDVVVAGSLKLSRFSVLASIKFPSTVKVKLGDALNFWICNANVSRNCRRFLKMLYFFSAHNFMMVSKVYTDSTAFSIRIQNRALNNDFIVCNSFTCLVGKTVMWVFILFIFIFYVNMC